MRPNGGPPGGPCRRVGRSFRRVRHAVAQPGEGPMIQGGRVRFTATGRALKHRNFRLFFFGQLISVTGTWMQTLAQAWLIVTLVGSDQAIVYLGLLGAVQFLPVLVLGLFGGIIADVWPKRMTVIGTQMVAGLLALTLGGLDFFHVVAVWHIFVLAFLLGIVNAVDMPTRQSFVVEMVGRDDIANAVALNSAVFSGGRIVGPAIAGILIGILGTALCFVLNGLSYGAVVISLLAMRDSELMPAARLAMPRSLGAIRENLGEGLRYVWNTPVVLLAIGVIGFVSTFGMNFNAVLPVMAARVLNVGANGLGFLFASMGAGAMISALAVATLARPRLRVLIGGGMVLGAAETGAGEHDRVPGRAGCGLLLWRRRDRDGSQRQLAYPDNRAGSASGSRHERVHDRLRGLSLIHT